MDSLSSSSPSSNQISSSTLKIKLKVGHNASLSPSPPRPLLQPNPQTPVLANAGRSEPLILPRPIVNSASSISPSSAHSTSSPTKKAPLAALVATAGPKKRGRKRKADVDMSNPAISKVQKVNSAQNAGLDSYSTLGSAGNMPKQEEGIKKRGRKPNHAYVPSTSPFNVAVSICMRLILRWRFF